MLRGWMLVALAALATGCPGSNPISPPDRAQLGAAITAAEVRARGLVDARTSALRAALASSPPKAGPCTFALPPANALLRPDGGAPGPDARTAKLHFTLLPEWALLGQPRPPTVEDRESLWGRMGLTGTNSGQFELSLRSFKDTLARGTYAPGEDLARLTGQIADLSARSWDWELIVVTHQVVAPREIDDEHFASGYVVGRAFVWSYGEGRIRCAGSLLAENRDSVRSIKVDPGLKRMAKVRNGFLDGDLEDQTFAAAVTGLQEVAAP